jgi:polysaccharide export outer membrane protein
MQQLTGCRICTVVGVVIASLWLGACARYNYPLLPPSDYYGTTIVDPEDYRYLIGPGDNLQIFVWRNPEVSQSVIVRPDGSITTPLVEDLPASGKTPTQLARDIEKALETYIRQPIVTVLVAGGVGPYNEQIRVVGEAAKPQALPYREHMTLLDLMIVVGGTTQFADGNNASILRVVDGELKQFRVRVDDLLKDGDITANVDMLPGDILIIPESWF